MRGRLSPVLARLIEEVRQEKEEEKGEGPDRPTSYNRTYNRHMKPSPGGSHNRAYNRHMRS